MLPKKNRADRKAIEKIFKKGSFFNSPNFTFKYIHNINITNPRISFIVPKSVSKLAVKRNSLRRCGYDILSKNKDFLPKNIEGVFVFKKYREDVFLLEKEILGLLKNIK